MLTFHNLKRLGLLVEKEPTATHTKNLNKLAAVANIPKSSNFRGICKKLHLVIIEFSMKPFAVCNITFIDTYQPFQCISINIFTDSQVS